MLCPNGKYVESQITVTIHPLPISLSHLLSITGEPSSHWEPFSSIRISQQCVQSIEMGVTKIATFTDSYYLYGPIYAIFSARTLWLALWITNLFFRPGESDAQAASAVPQRGLRLLLRQPVGPRDHHEAVFDQGQVAEFDVAVVGRTMSSVSHPTSLLNIAVLANANRVLQAFGTDEA